MCLGSESDAGSVNSTPIPFSGTIARVEIYDSVWTDEEIQAAFEQERPLFFDGICTSPGDPYQFVVSSPDGGETIDFEWKGLASEVHRNLWSSRLDLPLNIAGAIVNPRKLDGATTT